MRYSGDDGGVRAVALIMEILAVGYLLARCLMI